MKIPKTDMDYVEYYANKLKTDNNLFKQQKMLIDSQIIASRSLFKRMFSPKVDYKKNARKYLRSINLI